MVMSMELDDDAARAAFLSLTPEEQNSFLHQLVDDMEMSGDDKVYEAVNAHMKKLERLYKR